MNDKKIKIVNPLIFTKKLKDNHKIIPLNTTINTLGAIRHFPPATREWFNSIYAYNNNSIKNLSIADKNMSRLIKSYFNLYFSNKVLKSKRIATRFRRLSFNKIFISKAELKHTSSKVIITLYIYNQEKRLMVRKLKKLARLLFPSYFERKNFESSKFKNKNFKNKNFKSRENKCLPMWVKLNYINKQRKLNPLLVYLTKLRLSFVELKVDEEKYLNSENYKLLQRRRLFIENLESHINNIFNTVLICKKDKTILKKCDELYKEVLRKTHLEKEIMQIAYYKLLLNLNRSKFEDNFLSRLKPLISKIYNKEIEFNIVNLKTLYLNSDIFTQAIAIKLKNRDNKLLKVLKKSLHMIKLPDLNKIKERYEKIDINNLWVNKVNNLKIDSVIHKNNKDILNQLLLDLFPNFSITKGIEKNMEKITKKDKSLSLKNNKINASAIQDIVLNDLKYKSMAGARLEAKGRLTRRFTASRSVFKVKWKGSLKNIDSSYKGLSSVILRGHLKSNVQYSIVNSKNRNGAFGLKGWISSK